MRADSLLQLVGPLYRGFVQEDGMLIDVLASVSGMFAADSCHLVVHDEAQDVPLVRYAHRPIDNHGLMRAYDEHYGKLNPFRRFIARPEHLGASYSSCAVIAPEEYERSEFYNDFCKKLQWRYCLAAAFLNRDNRLGYIIFDRAAGAGPFDLHAEAALDQLLPHLANAYAMRTSFSDAFSSVERTLFHGEQKQAGMIFLDGKGRAVMMNDCMRQIFAAMDGLSYVKGEIAGGGWEQTRQIRTLIETAVSCAKNPDTVPVAKRIVVKRPSGRNPYLFEIVPIMAREQFVEGNDVVVALRIVDPELSADQQLLQGFDRYRLTPAEVRLVRYLISGLRPKEVAIRTGLSLNTIHVQQRSVYRKLGVSRHFEMMKIFAPNWGYSGAS